jgi:hypothetical protein
VHVHPAWPEQRRVQAILVVGSEDDDALLAARRPQTVDEIEQTGQSYAGLSSKSDEPMMLAIQLCS